MNKDKLNEILEKHKLWLAGGKGGERADLRYANLRGADLRDADLRGADLRDADLRDADLSYVDLRYADLYKTNLTDVDLSNIDLSWANLKCANLTNAFLKRANLYKACLEKADLSNANLNGADLRYVSSLNGVNGYRVISVQMDTTRKNNLIHYWVELDIVTTGCFQGSLQELKDSVAETHKNNDVIRKRYEKAIEFIEYMVDDYKNEKAVNGN